MGMPAANGLPKCSERRRARRQEMRWRRTRRRFGDDQVILPSSSWAAVRRHRSLREKSGADRGLVQLIDRHIPGANYAARDRRSSDRCDRIGDIEPFQERLSDGKPMGLAGPIGKDHRIEPIFQLLECAFTIRRAFGGADDLDDPSLTLCLRSSGASVARR